MAERKGEKHVCDIVDELGSNRLSDSPARELS
jgi:hypothetical protein